MIAGLWHVSVCWVCQAGRGVLWKSNKLVMLDFIAIKKKDCLFLVCSSTLWLQKSKPVLSLHTTKLRLKLDLRFKVYPKSLTGLTNPVLLYPLFRWIYQCNGLGCFHNCQGELRLPDLFLWVFVPGPKVVLSGLVQYSSFPKRIVLKTWWFSSLSWISQCCCHCFIIEWAILLLQILFFQ